MQLQLVLGDDLDVLPSSQTKLRPMRDVEAASSILNAPRRAELSRQRHCVDFEHQTIELRQAFRTAPEPVTLESPPRNSSPTSILRNRSTSASVNLQTLERSATCSEDSEAPKEKLKKKKKVSFMQTEPEQELEQSFSNQCSCQSLKPSDDVKDMQSPIHAVCRRAELQALKHLLSFYFGADLIKLVNSSCACGRTPLEVACEAGDLRIVKLLLKRHADPNSAGSAKPGAKQTLSAHIRNHRRRSIDPMFTRKRKQQTCLSIACKNRKCDILELLMQYGARIDEDALVMAASHGHEDVVRTLVNFANADVKKKASPVHHLFHKKGAEANERVYVPLISSSTLQKACSAAAVKHPELIRVLLGEGKNTVSKQNVVKCAFDAVNLPDYRLIKCLTKMYDLRLLLEARDKTSQSSLLHAAVKNGSAKTVLLLIKMGADVHARDGSGIPPLYLACARGQEVVVQSLLEKGAKCTAVGPGGETPLHIAAQENQLACVKLLLEVGKVPVDGVTHDRCTALHLASQRGNTAVAACLLDHGANVDAMTADNESPLLKASRMSQFQTVKLLLSRNASTQQPILTSSSSEHKLTVSSGESFESASNSKDADAQLARSRSWNGDSKNSKNNERIFIAKSNTHTSLKHWLRSVLNN
ncbi:Ankyrin repeats (3 copies) [Phytophthora infestans]|uniref:Ankyrin repeats (3 copies) n=1 Tax=Phytophthora infestans TaxID=4787 RepID=A0A833TE36_PHYIN|nr:Ankyrin repeats (3 copies) [Phytophthora infestans]KAF4137551.1 Ankyrin repeats domain-containing protein [Phytophthora infestans]